MCYKRWGRNSQFSDEGDMGARNFNFAQTFPIMGDFQPQILYFWRKVFLEEEMFRQFKT